MSNLALRQTHLFEEPPTEVEVWRSRLSAAFEKVGVTSGFLPLAEEGLKACPGDPELLLMAATAAVLDRHPERALVLLKRFSKRADVGALHLLRALSLNQTGRREAAKSLLERHGLTTWPPAYREFPGGREHVDFLIAEINAIMGRDSGGRAARSAKGRKQPVAAKGKAEGNSKVAARSKPKPAKRSTNRHDADAAATMPVEPIAQALPPLPQIDIDIPFSLALDLTALSDAAIGNPEQSGRHYGLRERLAHLGLAQGFDELLCLPHLVGVEPYWHQIETVRKVLKQFRGRVLLADEVGLGKTVEAGMVLKEYALRGMAERVLVLTPASLVGQWREELEAKFGLDFATTYDPMLRDDPDAFWDQPRVIASIATGRRREHADRLAARQYDLVIVDEAHHLRDRTSASWKLVDALNKRFLLLLSATPVQNELIELYNLLTLLKPGIFKTLKEFRAAHMTPGKPRQPANPEHLRALMRGAMIRNTRAAVALKLPRRQATTIKVDGAPGEAEAYADLAVAARRLATAGGGVGRQRLTLIHLLTAAGSSPAAAAGAVTRIAEKNPGDLAWAELAQRLAGIDTGGKEAALLELLSRNPAEKKLVFVHSRETLEHVGSCLERDGISFAQFDGSLTGPQKDAAIAEFRDNASVLLCTQSGGEGRNIQFCNTLINFDVPWNPMAIEQRIGRIDRIGQTREVFVFNLVTRGTIEEEVLALLDEKISMFELVVGEVGAILGGLEEEREFPDLVLDAWLEASEVGRKAAFVALGARLESAREQHDGAKELDEKLFGRDFETA